MVGGIGRGLRATSARLVALALSAGCAVGANGGAPDGSGFPPASDATTREDGTTSGDGTVPFGEAGFPSIDARTNEAGSGGDAKTIFQDSGSPVDAEANTDAGSGTGSSSGSGSSSSSSSASSSGSGSGSSSSGCPVGTTGPGCTECASGFHLCGATCTADRPNVPTMGCADSCGGACTTSGTETAYCTDAGACASSCGPGTKLCAGNVCAACCTNADCPANVMCSSGTCSQCAPPFGTCATECDTDFSSTDNCGACDNECDTGFLGGCGLFGVGGQSCDDVGGTYSCGC